MVDKRHGTNSQKVSACRCPCCVARGGTWGVSSSLWDSRVLKRCSSVFLLEEGPRNSSRDSFPDCLGKQAFPGISPEVPSRIPPGVYLRFPPFIVPSVILQGFSSAEFIPEVLSGISSEVLFGVASEIFSRTSTGAPAEISSRIPSMFPPGHLQEEE